jgi:hypothetical protein
MSTRGKTPSPKRLVLVGLILVGLILVGLSLKAWRRAEVTKAQERNMEQFERVFKLYSNESKGTVFPPSEHSRDSGDTKE